MTNKEAKSLQLRFTKDPDCYAEIVRILPANIDPVKPGDSGWDVQITYHYNSTVYTD